jgi:hypothetical protein
MPAPHTRITTSLGGRGFSPDIPMQMTNGLQPLKPPHSRQNSDSRPCRQQLHLRLEQPIFANDALIAHKQLRPAPMRKHPNPRHIPNLQKHFQNQRNVIRPRHRNFVVRLPQQFILRVAKQFAKCRRNFDKSPARIHNRHIFRLDPCRVIAGGSGVSLILKSASEGRPELSHSEYPLWPNVTVVITPRQCRAGQVLNM